MRGESCFIGALPFRGSSTSWLRRRRTRIGAQTVTTNSFGMRDTEPAPPDAASIRNILALGDSFTFGFGVEAHETYPEGARAASRGAGCGRRTSRS